tara:strand:- start:2288 stop:2626 length:339 start_codon:yes stop_codon:yes gene_type:complete
MASQGYGLIFRHLDVRDAVRNNVNDSPSPEVAWHNDSMAWLSLLIGPSIWLVMVLFLSIQVAWISFACAGLIGLFLWLVALGYENPQMAKANIWGVVITAFLSLYSAYITFL